MAGKRIKCTDKEIIEASETTMSAFEASRKLGINYKTYRTYAIRLNCFKTNQSGKGMDKKSIHKPGYEFNEHYFDAQYKGYFFCESSKIYPELAQAVSILSGVCPKKYENDIMEGIKAEKYKPFTTFSYKIFKYDALLLDPRNKDFVRNEILNIWSSMLFAGATSFWETDIAEADFHNAGSLCHGWSAIPAYFYFKL